ncbi:hypothetical protein APHAL10511_003831 [Amanita phalloides]|nr:hypothetical protein APHAL10511_003831 [Amanita phalloides]
MTDRLGEQILTLIEHHLSLTVLGDHHFYCARKCSLAIPAFVSYTWSQANFPAPTIQTTCLPYPTHDSPISYHSTRFHPSFPISSIHSHLAKREQGKTRFSVSASGVCSICVIIYPIWALAAPATVPTMVWYPTNINLRDRAFQLSFDIRKLQHSAREKLVPAERLQQKRQMVDQVDNILRSIEVQDFPDLQQRLFATMTAQERMIYERLAERLRPVGQIIDPTLEVYTLSLIITGGSINKAVNVSDILHIAHLVATMRDYARSFVILCKYGLEAGKSAFSVSTQSARLVDDVIRDDEKLIKYASRSANLLRLVATTGLDPDPWVSKFSQATSDEEQKQKLQVAIHELYLRRLVSLYFERLCDAMMLHDGLLLNYLIHLTGMQGLHADETTTLLAKAMMNAWRNIDTATSVNMIAGTDARRDSWIEEDPQSSKAVQLLDEMKARIDVNDLAEDSQQEGYDLGGTHDLYEDDVNVALPYHEYDVDAQLQDIDTIFARFLPYPSPNV